MSILFAAIGFAAYVSIWGVRPLDRVAYVVLGVICFLGLIMGTIVDRMCSRFMGRITVSERSIRIEKPNGDTIETRWSAIQGIIRFTRWDVWGLAGGGHSGLLVVSESGDIVIFENIIGWAELRSIVVRKADEFQIHSSFTRDKSTTRRP